ncbi:MAG: fructokinase [Massilia sp.]|nr:fructokinase [Massilia sp.]
MNADCGTIVVFGEALVDDFITEQVVGGAPFNVARHLGAFAAAPLMLTRIGSDANGATVRAEFARFGMRDDGLQVDPVAPTGRVIVERSEGAHRFIILPDQAYDHIEAGPALAALARCEPATLYFGTLAQRASDSRDALFQVFAATPARRFLDLNMRADQVSERCVFASLQQGDIVKVNEDELRALFTWYTDLPADVDAAIMADARVLDACAALILTFSLTGLIVTLGARGAAYFGSDGVRVDAGAAATPAVAVKLVDTVGAGDAFSAIFLLGSARGWPLATTLARANEFAGAICGISGAVPSDNAFYQPWIARWLAH